MEKDNLLNNMNNQNISKEEIFLDYLNFNNSPLKKEDFIKPTLETFDKFFANEESSPKSIASFNKLMPDYFTFNNINISNLNNSMKKNKIMNANQEKIIMDDKNKINFNNKKDINLNEKYDEDNLKINLFNTTQNEKFTIEDLKKKKLIMNRESAKKSRLKKKIYIENLEKEYIILKEEIIRIKSNQNLNGSDKIYNEYYSNDQLIENIIKNNNNINFNYNFNSKDNEIYELKKEEINIITNNLEKNSEVANNYINKQKKILQYLLVKQIDIMIPIKIKVFQKKFLKLQTIDEDDSIETIKNKININLNTIIELYDIDGEDNNKTTNIYNKKKSMAYQIYDFYISLKEYVNQYDIIYNKIEKI